MSLYKDWTDLTDNQTDQTFKDFWKTYCETEKKVYTDILSDGSGKFTGKFSDMVDKFDVEPVYFMGFVDGIQDSLSAGTVELESVTAETDLDFTVDFEKLYYNMLKADAEHLYSIPEWDGILSEEKRAAITKEYKKSKTVVKGKKIGRNDPCPCGSGKKYKHCCGKN